MNPVTKLGGSLRDVLWRATRHWLSAIGALISLISGVAFFVIFGLQLLGRDIGPYTGVISYLVMPALFIFGLVLIPLGLVLLRRRERKGKSALYPVLDLNVPHVRSVVLAVAVFTTANLLVISTATYKGLDVLHSDQFCGGVCHSVMQPQEVAHLATAHASVQCADCHVGEGATHWTASKLRGVRQMWQFVTNDIKRPAPQPVEIPLVNCTRCHAEKGYREDKLRIARHYSDDEKTVEQTSVWRMRIGGFRDGKWTGIHAHNGMKIEYLSDASRQKISAVRVVRTDGTRDLYETKDTTALQGAQWWEMGCTDCHNRAGHNFQAPEKIVDGALARGALNPEIPFIRKQAVAVLSKPYATQAQALERIPADLVKAYEVDNIDPEPGELEKAGTMLAGEWAQNNFPQMNVSGGSYRNYQQHEPGCYRCHDKNHFDEKGASIQKKCAGTCHDIISDHEEKPEALDVLYP
jgi:hypothetical protein